MNLATVLKSEITRVSRKEVRSELQSLKKSPATHRSDIAALKRRIAELERPVAKLGKGSPKKGPVVPTEEAGTAVRFSAKGLAKRR